MNEIKNLKPFPKFCCSIGYIPTSYKISMTYEEQLLWLCDFLENTVIPTVNQNGQAVEELQNLYVELKQYVDDYFSNLDIQTEINNKLDEMAEAGTLTELITDYLNLKCILAFDNISDMSEATNLIDGSFAKTYGRLNLNDGGGAFYYVREIQNTDVVDGVNVVALDNPSLVAIKVTDLENKLTLSEIIDITPIGQIYTNDISKSCQSFAMADGFVYGTGCGSSSESGFLVKLNLSTGERVSLQNNLNIGHANDICYCDKDEFLYIACSGGTNGLSQISVYNTSLQFIRNIDFTNIGSGSVWGITYNSQKEVFYVLSGNQILEMNYALDTVINTKNMETLDLEVVGQSLFSDENYLFYNYNIPNDINPYYAYNRLDVYNINTLEFVCTQKIPILGEVEAGYFYNGYSYYMKNTQNINVIFKASNYQNNKVLSYYNNNIFLNKTFPVLGQNYNIYVNSNNTNFYADGSETHPFSNLWASQALVDDIPLNSLTFILSGDFSNYDFVVRNYNRNININGSSAYVKIGGINISSAENVQIQNIEVVSRSGGYNNLISVRNVKLLELNSVKLNGAGTEDCGVYAFNTPVRVNNIIISNSFTNNNQAFKLEENSSLFMAGSFSSEANIGITANTNNLVKVPYHFPISLVSYQSDWNTNIIGGSITFNLKDIKVPGIYRVEAGNTCSDAPSGYTTTPCRFEVNVISDVFIYYFVPINTNKLFVGIRSGSQSSITWTEVI